VVEVRSRREKWAAVSGIVAALSLAAALVFNGIQAHDSAVAQRQTKLATELGLLEQMQGAMTKSIYSRVPYVAQFRALRAGRRGALSRRAYRVTAEEAASMNYFAWLFNNGYVTASGADELLGPRMICEYQQAFAPALNDPAHDLPDLLQFIQERGRKLWKLVESCE
jgi:hypothetical protein